MSDSAQFRTNTTSRMASVQGIYLILFSESTPQSTSASIAEHYQESTPPVNHEFCKNIFVGFIEHQAYITKVLNSTLTEQWRIDRINTLTRSIIFAALTERILFPDTDTALIIKEYSRIARDFFLEQEASFVHSALNTALAALSQN